MPGQVIADRDGRCTRIRLDRPAASNACTDAMLNQLSRILAELSLDDATDVVVLSGAGADFCSGADVGDITALLALDAAARRATFREGMTTLIHPLVLSLLDLPQVVVAGARGHAIGLGAALVLAADVVVLSETARLSVPQVALGHTTDHGESYLLPRKIGTAPALRMVLLGERLSASDAVQAGMAGTVVADEHLEQSTDDVVATLLKRSSNSLRGTKHLLGRSLDRDRAAQFEAEVEIVSACAASGQFVTAIQSAFGGRTPATPAKGE